MEKVPFLTRARLAWRILRASRKCNSYRHAETELAIALPDGDEMNEAMKADLLELVLVFSTQGHSGFSAAYARSIFKSLASFEPLTPLTGADDEWAEVAEGQWQNKRCSRVFKDADGRAYDIDAVVFEEPCGARFTSRDSRLYIEFPYTPTTEIVKVEQEGGEG